MIGSVESSILTTVNGNTVQAQVEARVLLSDFLRHQLGLTGTHVGCEHGVCGACTVLVDNAPVRSCLMFAVQIDGSSVETVESLGTMDSLSPLQQSMWESHGLQCGFCTPGILMTVEGGKRSGSTVEELINESLPGHLCRCTGYQNIREAIEAYYGNEAVG